MSFNWQTEDNSQWDEQLSLSPARQPKRPRPMLWLALLGLIGLAGFLIWRQVNQHLTGIMAGLEEDVRASDELVRQAASQGDNELFVSLLSGREPRWTDAQGQLLDNKLLFGNGATLLGLSLLSTENPSRTVTLSADLNEALVTVDQQYRPGNLPDQPTITLQQTAIYRQGSQRWLLSPPSDEFWGPWTTSNSEHFNFVYPARDEAFALQLQQYLNEKLILLCQTQWVEACQSDVHIRVRLEKEPESLLPLLGPFLILRPEQEVVLPTPSLIGLPIDPAGADVLRRSYAAIILKSAVVQLSNWQCCRKGIFEQSLLEQLLVELEVLPRPDRVGLYRELINFSPFNLNPLERLWVSGTLVSPDSSEAQTTKAFVDFISSRSNLPAGELMRRLDQASRFDDWVATIPNLPADMEPLTRAWQEYVYLLSQAALQNYPTLPDQDLLALCTNSAGDTTLYRYNLLSNQATIVLEAARNSLSVVVLPDDNSFIATKGAENLDVSYFYAGNQTISLSNETQLFFPLPIASPPGQNLALGAILNQGEGFESFALLDPADCTPAGCNYQRIDGLPAWSPNGLQQLLLSFSDSTIILSQKADSSQLIGQGFAPFWFDDNSYGYLAFDNPNAPENERDLMVAATADNLPHLLIGADDLQSFLPDTDLSSYLRFTGAILHPFEPQTLLLLANSTMNLPKSYLFAIHRPDNNQPWAEIPIESLGIELLNSWPLQFIDTFPFSLTKTNDKWLLMTHGNSENAFLTLYDLQTQQTVLQTTLNFNFTFDGGIDWSADNQWLIRPGEGFLDLIKPNYDGGPTPYHHFIFHHFGYCSSVSWLNN